MANDEQAIRDLIETWHTATASGDLPRILSLMAEDVVFLVAGQPPMRGRDAFAAGFKKVLESSRIQPSSDIQEIHVNGDWAYVLELSRGGYDSKRRWPFAPTHR